ncbi:lipocalin [Pseudorhodobacter sp.]|uniref:lipocalin n=1 Tax=Pseudorhodobacter sp. TaxID=1934400 RepID=UPI002648B392|nr:lipocalin [Pseudorhodobacter sp.]MDN5788221.1 lipocalin [Pseudorhodobacter sp.]
MYRVAVGLVLILAGCVSKQTSPGFRDPGKQIYSNAVLETPRLVGQWAQVAEFATKDAAACQPGNAAISQAASGLTIDARLCLNGVSTAFSGSLLPAGPGRFTPPRGEVWWVIWADVGYRTLVIGTPSGAFGFILNRERPLPADRLRAAQEVLDWNGYNLAYLR